jgi:hypothetical protein
MTDGDDAGHAIRIARMALFEVLSRGGAEAQAQEWAITLLLATGMAASTQAALPVLTKAAALVAIQARANG